MSIDSHELVYSEPNGSRLDVLYKYIDHLVNDIYINVLVPAGTDLNADRVSRIASIELQQAEQEVSDAVGRAEGGISADILPDYQDQNDYDRRALGQFMTLADVHHFNEGLSLFQGMEGRGGPNAGQRAIYLGITADTYSEIESRFNDLIGSQTFINDNKNQRWDDIPEEMT